MSHFIITAIIVLAAAKAKAQVKDNLTNSKCREKIEAKKSEIFLTILLSDLKRGAISEEYIYPQI
jgi:hypothetical protein